MAGFPIRVLSEQTGVPATTLRAWERRYGLLKPARTPKGHRIYHATDLETVRQVLSLLHAGSTIGKAAKQVKSGDPFRPEKERGDSAWTMYQKRCMQSVRAFDDRRLDAVYNEALALYPIDLVTDRLLLPMLQKLGKEWQQRSKGVAEEHFFSSWLRNKVGMRMSHESGRTRGQRLLAACLPGEHHELGILLFCLSVLAHGYRLLYLGADLPLQQVKGVTVHAGVAGVLLSGSSRELTVALHGELEALAGELSVPLMVGGEVSLQLRNSGQSGDIVPLGVDYAVAMEQLQECVPPFGKRS